jgi:hypothetical protein
MPQTQRDIAAWSRMAGRKAPGYNWHAKVEAGGRRAPSLIPARWRNRREAVTTLRHFDAGTVARIIQTRAYLAGFDTRLLGGHSLKRGGLSTGVARGVQPSRLRTRGRHLRILPLPARGYWNRPRQPPDRRDDGFGAPRVTGTIRLACRPMAGMHRKAAAAGQRPTGKPAATADILRQILEPMTPAWLACATAPCCSWLRRRLRRAELAAVRVVHLAPANAAGA